MDDRTRSRQDQDKMADKRTERQPLPKAGPSARDEAIGKKTASLKVASAPNEAICELLDRSDVFLQFYDYLRSSEGKRALVDEAAVIIHVSELVDFVRGRESSAAIIDQLKSAQFSNSIRAIAFEAIFSELSRVYRLNPDDQLKKAVYVVGLEARRAALEGLALAKGRTPLQRRKYLEKKSQLEEKWQQLLVSFEIGARELPTTLENENTESPNGRRGEREARQKAAGLNRERALMIIYYFFKGAGQEVSNSKQSELIELLSGYSAGKVDDLYTTFNKNIENALDPNIGADNKFRKDMEFVRKRFKELGWSSVCEIIEQDLGGQ